MFDFLFEEKYETQIKKAGYEVEKYWSLIIAQDEEIEKLKKNLESCRNLVNKKDKEIEQLKAQIQEYRVNDDYCCACSNSYTKNNYYGIPTYGCILNVPCKNFQIKDKVESDE